MGDIQRRRQRKRVRFSGLSGGNIYSFMPCLRSRPASALFIDVLINAQRAPVSPEDRAGGSSRPPASPPGGVDAALGVLGGVSHLTPFSSGCEIAVPWGAMGLCLPGAPHTRAACDGNRRGFVPPRQPAQRGPL